MFYSLILIPALAPLKNITVGLSYYTYQLFRLDTEELDGLGSILGHCQGEIWINQCYIQLTAKKTHSPLHYNNITCLITKWKLYTMFRDGL